MGATVLGMQAIVGLLVEKALTSSTNPYYQGLYLAYSPVLALDVFMVQVCALYLMSLLFKCRCFFVTQFSSSLFNYSGAESWES